VNESRRPPPPPPLEANDQLVTALGTAGWAAALIVLLIVRGSLPSDARWWIWTCVTGLVMGLFGLWYVPRLKRARARAAQRRELDQSVPRESGSNTVSSTETPGRSTMS
jgi:hypothetical protein